ncbi:MAG: Hsp20/alpha crystallin family protein [Planctomycetota bacterium]
MAKQKLRKGSEEKEPTGLGGLLSGLGTVLEKLGELAETGEVLRKSGTFSGADKTLKGIYGFQIRTGLGGEGVTVEPFGNVRKDEETGRPVVDEVCEPMVDLFDEQDCVLVVAEMPGIAAEDVKLDLQDDIVTIAAERGDKKYRREVLLPATFTADRMSWKCHNGVLEVRFAKPTDRNQGVPG